MEVKISIIGLGNMGLNHLRLLSQFKNVKIPYIYDKNFQKTKFYSKKYKINYTNNLNSLLKESDGVIIATPTSTHYNYIKKSSKFLKNIFVEKPLTASYKEALKIKKLQKLQKLKIQCGFIERYNAVTPIIKKICKKEKSICVDFSRTDKLSDRIKDVNIVFDLMIHDIDLAIFFNGKIKKIFATGVKKKKDIVFAIANFIHTNNVITKIEASKITNKKIRLLNLTTKNSYVVANLLTKEITLNRQTNLKYQNPLTISAHEEKVLVTPVESLQKELFDFVNLCLNKKISVPNINESIENIKICEKIVNEINKKS